jgi:cytochrome c oxidase subunit 4
MPVSEVAEEHVAGAHPPYMLVWAALAILTVIEYFWAAAFKSWFAVLLLGLLAYAVVKAGLVGWWFMHLKYEGKWVYILIVPAFVLATIFVLALTPDMSMQPETDENAGGESSFVAPALDGPLSVPPIRLAAALDASRIQERAGV